MQHKNNEDDIFCLINRTALYFKFNKAIKSSSKIAFYLLLLGCATFVILAILRINLSPFYLSACVGAALIALLYCSVERFPRRIYALYADKVLQLDERLLTCVEFSRKNNAFHEFLIKDTCAKLQKKDMTALKKINVPREFIWSMALAGFAFCMTLIPAPTVAQLKQIPKNAVPVSQIQELKSTTASLNTAVKQTPQLEELISKVQEIINRLESTDQIDHAMLAQIKSLIQKLYEIQVKGSDNSMTVNDQKMITNLISALTGVGLSMAKELQHSEQPIDFFDLSSFKLSSLPKSAKKSILSKNPSDQVAAFETIFSDIKADPYFIEVLSKDVLKAIKNPSWSPKYESIVRKYFEF